MTASSAIDLEVGDVHGDHPAVPPFLAHHDQAGVGKVHRLIGILSNQLADPGVVFTEILGANQEAISHCRQDRIRVAKEMCHFGQDRFAAVKRSGQVAQQVLRPRTKPRFFARQRGDQWTGIEEIDHPFWLSKPQSLANERRILRIDPLAFGRYEQPVRTNHPTAKV